MVQQLKILDAVAEDQATIPITHWGLNVFCGSSSSGSNALFWPLQDPDIHMTRDIHENKIHIYKK